MTRTRQTDFLVTVQGDFAMTEHELRNKFKHWVEHNCHTTSSFGFEIEQLAKPIIKGEAE